jgi:hypothetical protein
MKHRMGIAAGLVLGITAVLLLLWPAPTPSVMVDKPAQPASEPPLPGKHPEAPESAPEKNIEDMERALQAAREQMVRMQIDLHGQVIPEEMIDYETQRLLRASGFIGERLISCDISALMTSGHAQVELPRDGLGRAHQDVSIYLGTIRFTARSDETAAEVTVKGVGIGMAEWPEAEPGSAVSCTDFTVDLLFGWVTGAVVDGDGEPAERVSVEGCGGRALVDEEGQFVLQAEPGPCEVAAVARANMARAVGEAVSVQPVAGLDVTGVVLVAPERPEMHPGTAEERARGRESLCRYWSEKAEWTIAVEQGQLTDETLTGEQRERVQESLAGAEARLLEVRSKYCQ